MKFMLTFAWKSHATARDEAIARFQKTGGRPPKGVRLVGRWTRTDFSGGYVLVESTNPEALTQFALAWSDIADLNIVPTVDDKQVSQLLRNIQRPFRSGQAGRGQTRNGRTGQGSRQRAAGTGQIRRRQTGRGSKGLRSVTGRKSASVRNGRSYAGGSRLLTVR